MPLSKEEGMYTELGTDFSVEAFLNGATVHMVLRFKNISSSITDPVKWRMYLSENFQV